MSHDSSVPACFHSVVSGVYSVSSARLGVARGATSTMPDFPLALKPHKVGRTSGLPPYRVERRLHGEGQEEVEVEATEYSTAHPGRAQRGTGWDHLDDDGHGHHRDHRQPGALIARRGNRARAREIVQAPSDDSRRDDALACATECRHEGEVVLCPRGERLPGAFS